MSMLNRDVLCTIFKELKDDKRTLFSCLLVNRTWCEIIVPILWKNPWKNFYHGVDEKSFINVINSHLSDELKNIFSKNLKNSYKRPLFDYISFCKNLDLFEIQLIISNLIYYYDYNYSLYEKEIFKLFINSKAKFTHLHIPRGCTSYKIHLIPGAKESFSEIEFLKIMINNSADDDILIGLSEICKSIKTLELYVHVNIIDGIIMLINAQKNLKEVYFEELKNNDEIIKLENSLIKHRKTIEYIKITEPPITNIFSHLENLKILKLDDINYLRSWDQLAAASLPLLQILSASGIPINALTSLIEKTNGCLKEINIDIIYYDETNRIDFLDHDDINNKRLIQAIYQKCPNLKYLKLLIRISNISKFEKLLVNCKYLDGLYIVIDDTNWAKLFEILTRSSPISLFKFKFYFLEPPKPEALKLFFDNWKGRHPMLLQTIPKDSFVREKEDYTVMIEKYKAKGVIKKYDDYIYRYTFKVFEWIKRKYNN
jgi:hypothetical protein